jgi:nucleoid-associated protein YgaU
LIESIAPGLHRLRVDQLGTDGQVMARVETPFSRAEVLAALPEESAVIVQPGNSLWRISRRIYGEGVRYSVIYQANQDQIRDPDLIYPGQIFILPSTD